MENNTSEWIKAVRLVRVYAYITIGAVIYGIAAAHVPFLIGHPWTTCENCSSTLWCVLVFHLFEVPPVSYNAYVAWFALKRFSPNTIDSFISQVTFAVAANIVFFAFECILLLINLKQFAPEWENWGLTSIALILLGGSGLGIYVKQKLISLPR